MRFTRHSPAGYPDAWLGSFQRSWLRRECQEPHTRRNNNDDHRRDPPAKTKPIKSPKVFAVAQSFLQRRFALSGDSGGEVDRDFPNTLASTLNDQLQSDLVTNRIEFVGAFPRFAA